MTNIQEINKETRLSHDLNVITAEINSYKQVAGQAIFEIGRRLKHVKENDLAHGEWEKWCKEKIKITPQHANRFIKITNELSEKLDRTSGFDLGVKALYEIATLPAPEREKEHEIPSTGESKTPDEMTVKELREVKQKLKEEQERAEQAENMIDNYDKQIKELNAQLEQAKSEESPEAKNKIANLLRETENLKKQKQQAEEESEKNIEKLKSYIDTHVDPTKERKAKITRFKNEIGVILDKVGGSIEKAKINLDDDIRHDKEVQESISRAKDSLEEFISELDEVSEIIKECDYIDI